jgi:hypothetical protein
VRSDEDGGGDEHPEGEQQQGDDACWPGDGDNAEGEGAPSEPSGQGARGQGVPAGGQESDGQPEQDGHEGVVVEDVERSGHVGLTEVGGVEESDSGGGEQAEPGGVDDGAAEGGRGQPFRAGGSLRWRSRPANTRSAPAATGVATTRARTL